MGRPREIAAARVLNVVMFALLLAGLFGFSVWGVFREITLMIQAHWAKPGEHLAHLFLALQPLVLFIWLAAIWRGTSRAGRPRA